MAEEKDTSSKPVLTPTSPIQEAEVVDTSMDELVTVTLKKKEFLIIFNVLANNTYSIANAMLVKPIADALFPIIKSDKEPHGNN